MGRGVRRVHETAWQCPGWGSRHKVLSYCLRSFTVADVIVPCSQQLGTSCPARLCWASFCVLLHVEGPQTRLISPWLSQTLPAATVHISCWVYWIPVWTGLKSVLTRSCGSNPGLWFYIYEMFPGLGKYNNQTAIEVWVEFDRLGKKPNSTKLHHRKYPQGSHSAWELPLWSSYTLPQTILEG